MPFTVVQIIGIKPMDENAQKEQFCRAYVQAVAAVAGFAWSEPSVDDDSIDLTLSARGGGGTVRSPRLDLQLKCHAQVTPESSSFAFPVKIKNYDDLRDDTVMVPRILVVVLVPGDVSDWIRHTEDELRLRRCGYWSSLRGLEGTQNRQTVSVSIDRTNLFCPDGLRQIMQRLRTGGLP
jgi:hypothetical protein